MNLKNLFSNYLITVHNVETLFHFYVLNLMPDYSSNINFLSISTVTIELSEIIDSVLSLLRKLPTVLGRIPLS